MKELSGSATNSFWVSAFFTSSSPSALVQSLSKISYQEESIPFHQAKQIFHFHRACFQRENITLRALQVARRFSQCKCRARIHSGAVKNPTFHLNIFDSTTKAQNIFATHNKNSSPHNHISAMPKEVIYFPQELRIMCENFIRFELFLLFGSRKKNKYRVFIMTDRAHCLHLPLYHPVARRGLSLIVFGLSFAVFELTVLTYLGTSGVLKQWIIGNVAMHFLLIGCGVALWMISANGGIEEIVQNLTFYLLYLPFCVILALWVWGCFLISHNDYWDYRYESAQYFLLAYETIFNAIAIVIVTVYFMYTSIYSSDGSEFKYITVA